MTPTAPGRPNEPWSSDDPWSYPDRRELRARIALASSVLGHARDCAACAQTIRRALSALQGASLEDLRETGDVS